MLLDGELVCLNDEGDPDFARLRARLRSTGREARLAARRAAATFLAFDLLHLDGRSTRELPYAGRRALLAELALDGPGWRTPRAFAAAEGPSLLEATRERGLEGVVMKRLDAPYLPGVRSAAWMKHKHRRSQNFVVTGWVPASGRQPEALLVARVGVEGRLAPAGSESSRRCRASESGRLRQTPTGSSRPGLRCRNPCTSSVWSASTATSTTTTRPTTDRRAPWMCATSSSRAIQAKANRLRVDWVVDFLRIFGVLLLFAAPICWAQGLIPWPVAAVAALGVLAVAIHAHRNRSLV